jgi:hypothetical protein
VSDADQGTSRTGIISGPSVRDSAPFAFEPALVSRVVSSGLAPILIRQKSSVGSLRSAVFPVAPGPIFLVALNFARLGLYLTNNSPTATLFIKLQSPFELPSTSPTSFTAAIPPGKFFFTNNFLGDVSGYWDPFVVGDNVQVTELV